MSINAGYSHFYCIIVIWCIEFDFPDVRLSTKKPNMSGVILQIPCPMSHESVSKSYVQLSTNFRDIIILFLNPTICCFLFVCLFVFCLFDCLFVFLNIFVIL